MEDVRIMDMYLKKKLNYIKLIWFMFEFVIVRVILICIWFKKFKIYCGYGRKYKYVFLIVKRNLLWLLVIDWLNGFVFYSIKRDIVIYG